MGDGDHGIVSSSSTRPCGDKQVDGLNPAARRALTIPSWMGKHKAFAFKGHNQGGAGTHNRLASNASKFTRAHKELHPLLNVALQHGHDRFG